MKMSCSIKASLIIIILTLTACNFQYGSIESEVREDYRNEGVDFSLTGDFEGNAIIHFKAADGNKAPVDLVRIVLQCLNAIDENEIKPKAVIFMVSGKVIFTLDADEIDDIAYNYRMDKPIPAWRLVLENSRNPEGSRVLYTYNLLQGTREALEKTQMLVPDTLY